MRKILLAFLIGALLGGAGMLFWLRGGHMPSFDAREVAAVPEPFATPALPHDSVTPAADPDQHEEVDATFDAPPAPTTPAEPTATPSPSPAASPSPAPLAGATPTQDPVIPTEPAAEPPSPEPAVAASPATVPAPADAQPSAVAAPSFTPQPGALLIPVEGIAAKQLIDTFTESRGGERVHEAIDIIAPKGTPVLAVEKGKVAKLFTSERGGLTVYQFDDGEKLAYYYAHLDSYAPGLAAGTVLERGDLVGYVGTSGNANPATPHLHFAVFVLGPEKQWWKGTAINPYPLLAGDFARALQSPTRATAARNR